MFRKLFDIMDGRWLFFRGVKVLVERRFRCWNFGRYSER